MYNHTYVYIYIYVYMLCTCIINNDMTATGGGGDELLGPLPGHSAGGRQQGRGLVIPCTHIYIYMYIYIIYDIELLPRVI